MFDIDATWNSDNTQDLLNNGLFGQIKVNGKILENKKKRKLKDAHENTERKKKKKKKVKKVEFEAKNDKISTDQIFEKVETSDKKELPVATNINKEQRKKKKKSKTVATVNQAELYVKDTQVPVMSETQSVLYVKDTKSLIEPVPMKEILTDSNATVNEVCVTSKKVKTKKVKRKASQTNKNEDEKNLTIKNSDINSQKGSILEEGLNTADKSSDNVDFDLSVTRIERDSIKKVKNILKEEEDKKARILLLKNNQNKSSKDKNSKYNKFQEKLSRKLEGGQFRWINEQLYTTKSYEAFRMFREAPQLFRIYHQGFESQVKYWPENPVDLIINDIKESEENSDVVADFGCGDAKISQSLSNKVHSFDLVAVNSFVTACDMRNVPLDNGSVDIAVFCLSLMGTNVVDFITEAGRVLKQNGLLKIAEVKSRFDDMKKFIKNIESLGFQLINQNEKNKMFILLDFVKVDHPSYNQIAKVQISMNPCIYKRR